MRFHTFAMAAMALFWRNSDFMPGAHLGTDAALGVSATALLHFLKYLVIFLPATDLH